MRASANRVAAMSAGVPSVSLALASMPALSSRFNLARLAVMRDTQNAQFALTARGERLTARRARVGLLRAAKAILGNSVYERVRAAMLNQG